MLNIFNFNIDFVIINDQGVNKYWWMSNIYHQFYQHSHQMSISVMPGFYAKKYIPRSQYITILLQDLSHVLWLWWLLSNTGHMIKRLKQIHSCYSCLWWYWWKHVLCQYILLWWFNCNDFSRIMISFYLSIIVTK